MADWLKGTPPDGPRVGDRVFDYPMPVATLDAVALEHNLATMAGYCERHGVFLAPHGKTTMSPEIIKRQLAYGAWAVTAATAWQAATIAGFAFPGRKNVRSTEGPGAERIILANQVVDPGSLAVLDRLLHDHPALELYCLVDSPDAVRLLTAGVRDAGRLRLLIELGLPGGRTGLRDDGAALALARRIEKGGGRTAGIAAFEGIVATPTITGDIEQVDALLDRLAALAAQLDDPIVTVGGSAYFDRVVAKLAGGPHRIVLRSGCYVTHDAGVYHELSPFGATAREPLILREALHVWAPVLSVPEPGLALAGLGRRDVSADAGMPVPQLVRPDRPLTGYVSAVNDQHAYVRFEGALEVGDLIRFGISHPCTTFDKWRVIPVIDDGGTVLDLVHPRF
jgi:D-serine deaminase-like pyridoxal phosphate-dependent protein